MLVLGLGVVIRERGYMDDFLIVMNGALRRQERRFSCSTDLERLP